LACGAAVAPDLQKSNNQLAVCCGSRWWPWQVLYYYSNNKSTQGGKILTEMATINPFWSSGQMHYLMLLSNTLFDAVAYIFE